MANIKLDNPFPEYGYFGPEYFCDREKETEKLAEFLHCTPEGHYLVYDRFMGLWLKRLIE